MDITQFYQTFFDEAEELLAEMEHLLLALDVSAPDNEQLNAIFRAAHSIKGGAATFGFTALTETTHLLENLLDRARRGELGEIGDPDLARGIDPGHRGALLGIHHQHRDPVTAGCGTAAQRQWQFQLRNEPPTDGEYLGREGPRPGGDEVPGPVQRCHGDGFQPIAAVGPHHHPSGVIPDPMPGQSDGVAGTLGQLRRYHQRRARSAQPPGRRGRLEDARHGGAAARQPGRDRQQEWAGARDHHPTAGQHGVTLEQRLHSAGRHHPGQIPPGKRQLQVVGAGRQHDGAGVQRHPPVPSGLPGRGAHREARPAARHRYLLARSRYRVGGDEVAVEIEANAFLHHMVRNIVGSLLPVGRGERPVEWLAELLHGRDRSVAGPTAPASGLTFLAPRYPAEWNLPAEVTL